MAAFAADRRPSFGPEEEEKIRWRNPKKKKVRWRWRWRNVLTKNNFTVIVKKGMFGPEPQEQGSSAWTSSCTSGSARKRAYARRCSVCGGREMSHTGQGGRRGPVEILARRGRTRADVRVRRCTGAVPEHTTVVGRGVASTDTCTGARRQNMTKSRFCATCSRHPPTK